MKWFLWCLATSIPTYILLFQQRWLDALCWTVISCVAILLIAAIRSGVDKP